MDKDTQIRRFSSLVDAFNDPNQLPDDLFIEAANLTKSLDLKYLIGPLDRDRRLWFDILYRPIIRIIGGEQHKLGADFEAGHQVEIIINQLINSIGSKIAEEYRSNALERLYLCFEEFEKIELLNEEVSRISGLVKYEGYFKDGYQSEKIKDLRPFRYKGPFHIDQLPNEMMHAELIEMYAIGVALRKYEVYLKRLLERNKTGEELPKKYVPEMIYITSQAPVGRGGKNSFSVRTNDHSDENLKNNSTSKPTLAALALFRLYHFKDSHTHLNDSKLAQDFINQYQQRDIQKYRERLHEFDCVPYKAPGKIRKDHLITAMTQCIELLTKHNSEALQIALKHLEEIKQRD